LLTGGGAPIAVISGSKVLEDDLTRWSIHCYACQATVSEKVLNPRDLDEQLIIHRKSHEIEGNK
jgi:hypothetical protein